LARTQSDNCAMNTLPNVARVGALIGDPVRAAMLGMLMDGSERPAGELASVSGVAPQSASAHLAKLLDGGLLAVTQRGRHRYFRLRNGDVAHAIETLSVAADFAPRRMARIEPAMKRARRCYDHVAGELGVAICDSLIARRHVIAGGDGYALGPSGQAWLAEAHIELQENSRRPLVRPCLDWSERRPHLAGRLGASICSMLESRNALRRLEASRAFVVTPTGRDVLRVHFGLVWPSHSVKAHLP
jgi:DNA-binding transcriptional ArsR family regulator